MKMLKSDRSQKKDKDRVIVSEPVPGEQIVRMNINVQKSFYKKIKQRALDEDKTVKDIVLESLEAYLRK